MNIRKVWTSLVFFFLYNRKWCNTANNRVSLPLFLVCRNRGYALCISTYINESFYLLDQKKKQVKIKCKVNILGNKETKAERVVIQSQNNYSFHLGYGFFSKKTFNFNLGSPNFLIFLTPPPQKKKKEKKKKKEQCRIRWTHNQNRKKNETHKARTKA